MIDDARARSVGVMVDEAVAAGANSTELAPGITGCHEAADPKYA